MDIRSALIESLKPNEVLCSASLSIRRGGCCRGSDRGGDGGQGSLIPLVTVSDTDLVTWLKELELWIQSQKLYTLEIEARKKICLRQLERLSMHLDAISDQ